MRFIRKYGNLLIWCLFYLAFAYSMNDVAVSLGIDFQWFLEDNLFTVAKYFFDVSILFTSYLYVVKKPFHSVLFMARCKEFYLWYIILYGLKICLFYVGYTAILFIGFPFLSGIPLEYDGSLLFAFVNLFAFVFSIYLVYVIILLLSGKQMVGLLSSVAINFNMAMVYQVFLRTDNETLLRGMEHFIMNFYIGIAIVLLGVIFIIFRRRDFLL